MAVTKLHVKKDDLVMVVAGKDKGKSGKVLRVLPDKEEEEGRDVLCPVALDDSWKEKCKSGPTWGHLESKLVVDFSSWDEPAAFDVAYQKLLDGLKMNY